MSDGAAPLSGGEGMGAATEAFRATLDAETPSRSTKREARREETSVPLDSLFPRKSMDRSEPEGGANTVPDAVKRARQDAGRNAVTEDEEGQPRTRKARRPTEVTDEAEPDAEPDADLPDDDPDAPEDDEELPDDPEEGEEGDEEEGEEEEGEQEEAGPLDLSQVVEVQIDGKPQEVSLKEALRGYIRTETFHQRLGELAQGVQTLNTQRSEIDQTRKALLERAEALETYVQAFMPTEPNWEELYNADPVQAARYERQWKGFMEKVDSLKAQRETHQQELTASQQAQIAAFAQTNRAQLAQAHPEWKNEKSWRRDHDSMRRTARTVGYTDQEIAQLYDARGVEILLKAAKYDRLMASKPKPVARVKPNSNGTRTTPLRQQRNGRTSLDRAEARLSRTGSLQDAASVFERILDHER